MCKICQLLTKALDRFDDSAARRRPAATLSRTPGRTLDQLGIPQNLITYPVPGGLTS